MDKDELKPELALKWGHKRRLKCVRHSSQMEEKKDRISALPDSLIQHILSFFPSTKQAIQTGVLSKRWLKQWTHVPVLAFHNTPFKCVHNALILHNCLKMKKFYVKSVINPQTDSQFTAQVRFATMKCVEELVLNMIGSGIKYRLPNFLFNYSSLVKLETACCRVLPKGEVDWGVLKDLKLEYCDLTDDAIKNVLSGSPSLESLELHQCWGLDELVIASKSLKVLILSSYRVSVTEILCSNLVDLRLYLNNKALKSIIVPCLIRATLFLGFPNYKGENVKECQSMAKYIFESIRNVEELVLGYEFVEVLSTLKIGVPSSPLLNCKRLTLSYFNFCESAAGIAFMLNHSPRLENLVLKDVVLSDPSDLIAMEENWWNSNETIFNCLGTHLKTVKVTVLEGLDGTYKHELNFLGFILKNARHLEKLSVILIDKKPDFVIDVSNKLLSFPKCSQHAIVELCSR